MTNVYIIQIKSNGEKQCFTSLEAMYIVHDKTKIKVGKKRVGEVLREKSIYENNYVIIEKMTAYTRTDALDLVVNKTK